MNENSGSNAFDVLHEHIAILEELAAKASVEVAKEVSLFKEKTAKAEQKHYQELLPWERVKLARHSKRPVASDYIESLFTDFTELHGDRYFKDDQAIIGGVARFNGQAVTVIGQQKGKTTKENIKRNFAMASPEGYRKALRLMQQAEKFGRPVVTFIDTPGAYPGMGAEERGQAEAIARNLMEMSQLTVPVVAIVIGEGGSGGALGLGVANHVFMLENAIYSVISPEGLSSILWKDATRAQEAANIMKLTAQDLLELSIIEGIIAEPSGGAHRDFETVVFGCKKEIAKSLESFKKKTPEQIREERYQKFRQIG